MDCRGWAVDDDRSRRKWAVDEDRHRIRLAVDDDRRRRRWAADDDRRRRRWEVDDYPPLHLPLQWRDPPPHYLHENSRQRRRAVDLDRRRKALQVAQVKASLDRIDVLCVDFMHSMERIMSRSTTIRTPSLCSANPHSTSASGLASQEEVETICIENLSMDDCRRTTKSFLVDSSALKNHISSECNSSSSSRVSSDDEEIEVSQELSRSLEAMTLSTQNDRGATELSEDKSSSYNGMVSSATSKVYEKMVDAESAVISKVEPDSRKEVCDGLLALRIAEMNTYDVKVCGKATRSGTVKVFTTGVKMPHLNSSEKVDLLESSQAVRRNVNKGSYIKFVRPGEEAVGYSHRKILEMLSLHGNEASESKLQEAGVVDMGAGEEKNLCENFSLEDKFHPKFVDVADLEFHILPRELQMVDESAKLMNFGVVRKETVINKTLSYFKGRVYLFLTPLSIDKVGLHFLQRLPNEMVPYAVNYWDVERECSYGWIECVGITNGSGVSLGAHDTYLESREVEKLVITPFFGNIIDGNKHSFEFGITDALEVWFTDVNLHIWLGSMSYLTEGSLGEYKATMTSVTKPQKMIFKVLTRGAIPESDCRMLIHDLILPIIKKFHHMKRSSYQENHILGELNKLGGMHQSYKVFDPGIWLGCSPLPPSR